MRPSRARALDASSCSATTTRSSPRGRRRARPFSRDGRRVYRPGVADMKGGIAVALPLRGLAAGSRPFGIVELVSASDEEARRWQPATLERLSGDARPVHGVRATRRSGRLCAEGRPLVPPPGDGPVRPRGRRPR